MKFEEYQINLNDSLFANLSDSVDVNHEGQKIVNIYSDEDKTFMLLQDEQGNYSRLNWDKEENTVGAELIPVENFELVESEQTKAIAEMYAEKGKKQESKKPEEEEQPETQEETPPEEEDKGEEEKKKYELLEEKYSLLEQQYNSLLEENENLKNENQEYKTFKLEKEKEEKQEMINSFYMLSEEDKKDVLDNIDTYSLDDIEAKLSVICVRKRINFNLDEEDKLEDQMTFSLGGSAGENNDVPEWVKAVQECERSLNM